MHDECRIAVTRSRMIASKETGIERTRPIACPLCQAGAEMAIPTAGRPYHRCAACDLIFVPENWHIDEDAQRRRYALHDNTLENAGYVEMLGKFVGRFRRHAPPQCRVLDIGCGLNQVLVSLLRSGGYDAHGHDPLYGISGLEQAPFDAIVSTETIEHFSTPRREFDRIARLLRGGGVLAVTTQFHRGLHSMPNWWYARDPTHVSFYSHATMIWIARHDGFDLLEMGDADFCAMRRPES